MATVIIPLEAGEIQTRMQEIRLWLDSNGLQSALFTYELQTLRALARLRFVGRKHAEAFATEFAGDLI